MICPACPVIAMTGSAISAYFGFDRKDLRPYAVAATTVLTGVTVVALRILLGISICDGNGDFSPRNFVQVGAISIVLGIVYTVAIQYLLNRYVPPQQPEPAKRSCCGCK